MNINAMVGKAGYDAALAAKRDADGNVLPQTLPSASKKKRAPPQFRHIRAHADMPTQDLPTQILNSEITTTIGAILDVSPHTTALFLKQIQRPTHQRKKAGVTDRVTETEAPRRAVAQPAAHRGLPKDTRPEKRTRWQATVESAESGVQTVAVARPLSTAEAGVDVPARGKKALYYVSATAWDSTDREFELQMVLPDGGSSMNLLNCRLLKLMKLKTFQVPPVVVCMAHGERMKASWATTLILDVQGARRSVNFLLMDCMAPYTILLSRSWGASVRYNDRHYDSPMMMNDNGECIEVLRGMPFRSGTRMDEIVCTRDTLGTIRPPSKIRPQSSEGEIDSEEDDYNEETIRQMIESEREFSGTNLAYSKN
jgi:hypothetical protein